MIQTQSFPGRFDAIRAACEFVRAAAEHAGFDAKAQYHVELACDEACCNIIQHAYGGEDVGDVTISHNVDDSALIVKIHDLGTPFQPEKVKKPTSLDPESSLDDISIGGLGVHMMRKLMDEVVYTFDADGNTVTLVKWLAEEGQAVWQRTLMDGTDLVRIFGRIDNTTTPQIETTLNTLLEKDQPAILIDLNAADYINSIGLRALVTAWRMARQKSGNVILCGLNDRIRDIVAMVGFDKIMWIVETVRDGQAKFSDQ